MSSSAQHMDARKPSTFSGITLESPDCQPHDSEIHLIQKISSISGPQHGGNFQALFDEQFDGETNFACANSNDLPRHSITTVLSTPIVQLQGFLSDAHSSVDISPDDLSQLSFPSKLEVHPQEGYPKYARTYHFFSATYLLQLQLSIRRSSCSLKIERLIRSFPLNLFTMLCILVDVGVIITDVALHGYAVISIGKLVYTLTFE